MTFFCGFSAFLPSPQGRPQSHYLIFCLSVFYYLSYALSFSFFSCEIDDVPLKGFHHCLQLSLLFKLEKLGKQISNALITNNLFYLLSLPLAPFSSEVAEILRSLLGLGVFCLTDGLFDNRSRSDDFSNTEGGSCSAAVFRFIGNEREASFDGLKQETKMG